MKASSPEKIFLEREEETDKIHYLWGNTPVVSSAYEHIEYIRKDVFIEKVVEYIASNMRCDGYTIQSKAKFIRDFKNYMKGE